MEPTTTMSEPPDPAMTVDALPADEADPSVPSGDAAWATGFTWTGANARIEAHPADDPVSFTPLAERNSDDPTPDIDVTAAARPPQNDSAADHQLDDAGAVTGSSFPGGRPRLPRLDGSNPAPTPHLVGSAYVRTEITEQPSTGYQQYFTYESLFEPDTDPEPAESSHHYAVLGLEPDADWGEVIAAHRRLVKANHPDHLVDATSDVRNAAEERLRVINVAYGEVRRLRGS